MVHELGTERGHGGEGESVEFGWDGVAPGGGEE